MRLLLKAFAVGGSLVLAQESLTTGTDSPTTAEPATTTDTVSTTSTSTLPITHTIAVGKGGHTFEPDVTLARQGDTIKFEFYPTNHSVVRAEYGYPCIPYEYTGIDKIGFYTGFQPVDAILDNPPAYYLLVNDSIPIFFYCGAPGSCINWQMVGVINPNGTTSLQKQKQLAKDASFMLLPGEPFPNEAEDPFPTTSTTPSTTPTAGTSSSALPAGATTTASESSSSHSSGLTTGAIAGIAIGAAGVALAAAVLIYMCGRRSQKRTPTCPQEDRPATSHTTTHSMAYNPHGHIVGQYMDPGKHMSTHGQVIPVSPALPGYAPQYDPARSPPMPAPYTMSDYTNTGPGSDVGSFYSMSSGPVPSPNHYQHHQYSPFPYSAMPPPMPNLHEMADSNTNQANLGRRSSTSKSVGNERYG